MTALAPLRARFMRYSRRERGLVAAAVLVAILLPGYALLIDPPLKKRALLGRQLVSQQAERETLRQALAGTERDPNAALRTQLDTLQAQLRATDREFGEIQNGLVRPQHMGALLQSLLTEHRGLQLLGLRTLPVATAIDAGADRRKAEGSAERAVATAASTASAASAASDDAWLFRHGVEIRVQGSYADLTSYLQDIEALPRRVYWGAVEIDARHYPANVMTVTIYTLSLEKSWWVL